MTNNILLKDENIIKENIENIQNTQMVIMNILQTLQENVISIKKDISMLSSKKSSSGDDDHDSIVSNEEDEKKQGEEQNDYYYDVENDNNNNDSKVISDLITTISAKRSSINNKHKDSNSQAKRSNVMNNQLYNSLDFRDSIGTTISSAMSEDYFFNNTDLALRECEGINHFYDSLDLQDNISMTVSSGKPEDCSLSLTNIDLALQERKGRRYSSSSDIFQMHNLMAKSLVSIDQIYDNMNNKNIKEKAKSFQTFALLSVNNAGLLDSVKDWGMHNLDYVACKASLLDQYPSSKKDDNHQTIEDPDAISLFCFPEGVKLRILPHCAIDGAVRLGWLGEKSLRYQIHVFNDAHGNVTYGISINIKTEKILPNLTRLMAQRTMCRASKKIAEFWRRTKSIKRSKSARKSSNVFASCVMFKPPPNLVPSTDSISMPVFSERAKRLAEESYKFMMDNDRLGYACIVEKCYLIAGIKHENFHLLFRGLKQIIDFESENKYVIEIGKCVTKRHQILQSMQYKINVLPYEELRFSHPQNDWECFRKEKIMHEVQLASFLPKLEFRFPPPLISREWGVYRLILRLNLPSLFVLIQLLLLERSVLVIGDSYEEVTACTCALVNLLEPFKWVSAFISTLPISMLTFVSSPVPFIAGVVAESKEDMERIRKNNDVKQEARNGLTVVNLVSGNVKIKWNKVQDETLCLKSPILYLNHCMKLESLQRRVEYLSRNKMSSLHSFTTFIENGLSPRELLTLCSIKDYIKDYIVDLSGLLQHADGWKEYGEYDKSLGESLFSPKKKLEELERKFHFQCMITNSQLSAYYFEEKKTSHFSNLELKVNKGTFIAEWLYYAWCKFKKRKCVI